jgi:hypothetical protein
LCYLLITACYTRPYKFPWLAVRFLISLRPRFPLWFRQLLGVAAPQEDDRSQDALKSKHSVLNDAA